MHKEHDRHEKNRRRRRKDPIAAEVEVDDQGDEDEQGDGEIHQGASHA